jgi:hypothetical protein
MSKSIFYAARDVAFFRDMAFLRHTAIETGTDYGADGVMSSPRRQPSRVLVSRPALKNTTACTV